MNNKIIPPKRDWEDFSYSTTIASLAATPLVGGSLVEIFNALVGSPISKRRERWMKEVSDSINKLNMKYEELANNEEFVSVFVEATLVAIKSHHNTKLSALKNCVINSAIDDQADESMKIVFVSLIDSFTVWHIKILLFLNDPKKWISDKKINIDEKNVRSHLELINLAFPSIDQNMQSYIYQDLINKNLIHNENLLEQPMIFSAIHEDTKEDNKIKKLTTSFGDVFINYIQDAP